MLVNICGVNKNESTSEKLLGVIVNNTATFRTHIYGDDENQGLLKQLSGRVGILKRLKRFMPPACLKTIMEGLFSSKIMYGMTTWGRVWHIPGSLDEETRTSTSITKDHLKKVQVLQNKCMRIICSSDYKTPTSVLLQKTNALSVHQLMAQLSLSQMYSIFHKKLPAYHCDRLFNRNNDIANPGTRTMNMYSVNRIEFNLSLARTHFFYQASRLWTAIPDQVKSSKNKGIFKKRSKAWVKANILIKP